MDHRDYQVREEVKDSKGPKVIRLHMMIDKYQWQFNAYVITL